VVTPDILRREWSRGVTPLKNDEDGGGVDNDDDNDNDNSSYRRNIEHKYVHCKVIF
jgi:hypothetical protein